MEIVNPMKIGSYEARSAALDIDLETIQKGCDAILSELSVISSIHNNFDDVSDDIDASALSINGESPIAAKIGNCDSEILSAQRTIENLMNDTLVAAINAYNQLQTNYNNDIINQYNTENSGPVQV